MNRLIDESIKEPTVRVELTLSFLQMSILALFALTATRVSFVVMKRAAGDFPTTSFAANVEAFGCHDALGQKIGWLYERAIDGREVREET